MAKAKNTIPAAGPTDEALEKIITLRMDAGDVMKAAELKSQGVMVSMADGLARLVEGNDWDYNAAIGRVTAKRNMKGPQVSEYGVFCKAARDGYYWDVKKVCEAKLATPKADKETRPPLYKFMLDMCRGKARENDTFKPGKEKFQIKGKPDASDADRLLAAQRATRGGGTTTAPKADVVKIVDGKNVDWKATVGLLLQIEAATDGALSFREQIDLIRNKIAASAFNEANGTKSLPPAPPAQPTAQATIAANTAAPPANTAPVDLEEQILSKVGNMLDSKLAALLAAAKS